MPTWAPITKKIIDKGFGGSRNGQPITGAVVHHGAGTDVLGYVANANSRSSHPTYHIANDGTVTGIVHPDRRPYSTAHSADANAITFEIDNETGAPEWRVSAKALESLAQVLAHHAKESPREDRAEINEPARKQTGFWVGWHAQYVATACPGPYVIPRMPSIVDRVNAILGGAKPAPQPAAPGKPADTAKLEVDGGLGSLTITDWQRKMGTTVDGFITAGGSELVEAVQRHLNAAGARDWDGKKLVVDGIGIQSNVRQRVPASGRWRTIWALQDYLGTHRDGVIDRGDSAVIRELQRRLNTGRF